jgi:hypothetical protein
MFKLVLADYQETHWLAMMMEGQYEEAPKQGPKWFTREKQPEE